MTKGTPLQEVYDAFFVKTDTDYTDKEDMVFQFLKAGVSKSYKTTPNKLDYWLVEYKKEIVFDSFGIVELPNPEDTIDITVEINGVDYIVTLENGDGFVEFVDKLIVETSAFFTIDYSVYSEGVYNVLIESPNEENIETFTISGLPFEIEYHMGTTYEGYFEKALHQDEIELIAMFMLSESYYRALARLNRLKQYIGTKDFNRLPEKRAEYALLQSSISDLDDKIEKFRNEFYTFR